MSHASQAMPLPASRRAIPRDHAALAELAAYVLFPSLVFGTAFLQQTTSDGLFVIGQALLWVALVAAAEVIVVSQGRGGLLLLLAAMLVASRVALALFGEAGGITAAYEVANGLIFALAGAAVVVSHGRALYRQVVSFLAISVPVMIGQLAGWPAWLQVLRTDIHGERWEGTQLVRSVFQADPAVTYVTIQARPAGLLHANNFLSIVLLFAISIHFSHSRDRRISRGDVALIAVIVLAMAKIVFLTFLAFSVVYLLTGSREQRIHLGRMWLLTMLFFGIYYVVFPGAFAYNLSPNNVLLNYSVRVADLRSVLTGITNFDVLVEGFDGVLISRTGYEAGSLSGYARMARSLSTLVPFAVLGAILLAHRLLRLRRSHPALAEIARNGVIILVLAPLITSFYGNPFYSFAMGAVLVPWLVPSPATTQATTQASLSPSVP